MIKLGRRESSPANNEPRRLDGPDPKRNYYTFFSSSSSLLLLEREEKKRRRKKTISLASERDKNDKD
jgi:hypothetical protein